MSAASPLVDRTAGCDASGKNTQTFVLLGQFKPARAQKRRTRSPTSSTDRNIQIRFWRFLFYSVLLSFIFDPRFFTCRILGSRRHQWLFLQLHAGAHGTLFWTQSFDSTVTGTRADGRRL
jgi:hypothetical protein